MSISCAGVYLPAGQNLKRQIHSTEATLTNAIVALMGAFLIAFLVLSAPVKASAVELVPNGVSDSINGNGVNNSFTKQYHLSGFDKTKPNDIDIALDPKTKFNINHTDSAIVSDPPKTTDKTHVGQKDLTFKTTDDSTWEDSATIEITIVLDKPPALDEQVKFKVQPTYNGSTITSAEELTPVPNGYKTKTIPGNSVKKRFILDIHLSGWATRINKPNNIEITLPPGYGFDIDDANSSSMEGPFTGKKKIDKKTIKFYVPGGAQQEDSTTVSLKIAFTGAPDFNQVTAVNIVPTNYTTLDKQSALCLATPDGGTSFAGLGTAFIDFPPGAVTTDTEILFGLFPLESFPGPTLVPPGYSRIATAREFGPDGTTFETPVTITIPYASLEIQGMDENSLRAFKWTGSAWTLIPSVLNVDSDTVSFQTTSFSIYGIGGETLPPTGVNASWLTVLAMLGTLMGGAVVWRVRSMAR